MKTKRIGIGILTGVCFLAEQHLLAFLEFPYLTLSVLILFVAIPPVSIAVYKFSCDRDLSMDSALQTGISANIAWLTLFVLEIVLMKDFTFYQIAGISFFSLLFGFVFTAVSASLFVKGKTA